MVLEDKIKQRLRREITDQFGWSDIVAAFQASTQQDKANLVRSVRERRAKAVSRDFLRVIGNHINAQVQSEYDTILADGALSVAELERLFP